MDGKPLGVVVCARPAPSLGPVRSGAAWIAFLAAALLLRNADALAEPPERGEVRVARLIRELGSSDYQQRRAADAELAALARESREQLQAALNSGDVEQRLRARRLLDRLALEELWAAGRVNLQARGESASKILLAAASQSGNHIHIGDPYGNFAEKTLEANYAGMSYWEVVDDVCRRTGNRIRPHYDMHTPGIVISAAAPGNYPRAYSGPVRAQITSARRVFIEELSYEEGKAELTHSFQIGLQFMWEDRFRLVGYAAQPELVEALTDTNVVIASAQPGSSSWNATSRGLRQVAANLKLNPVPVSAKSLDYLKIRWGIIAVGEPALLELDSPHPEQTASQDDLAVKIEGIEKEPSAKYTLTLNIARDLALPEPHEVLFQEYDVELLDAQGRPFRQQSQASALSERGVQLKITFVGESAESEPRKLKLQYPRLRARRDLEIVFRNVPLPASRPE